ncbi:RHS repeat-associated core domain-containing protein [Idiomarina fontislapidosi]|uniref:RHS repeat-associated core domain-containing protein n=1 Tax=Idiomarina fontislapidosi TaxID=263723 RepID=UPI001F5461EF|nr:RHS repeat-associated core domain-containing protein [Idiomarina fontislapidosi]
MIAKRSGSTVRYFHSDYLGSTAATSNASGTILSRQHYQPFGAGIETPDNEVGYTGHKYDRDTGLVYMQARYYDPVIGRFYSNDPVGYTSANPVMSFNRYLYVNNNPYKYTDPNGEFLDAIVDIGLIAYDLYDMATAGINATNTASLGANVAGLFIPGATGLGTAVRAGDKAVDTVSVTSNQALRQAKDANGIPRSAQPDKTIKPGTPEGNAAGLDSRNVKQYEYTNGAGEKITIRQDKAASYGQGGKGDQKPHFNAGPSKEGKLKQHHYYEDKR